MNSMRYNLIMYQEIEIINFLDLCFKNRGKNISQVKYAYILHDKDIDINGNLKKPHFHLYIEFPTQVKDRDIFTILELAHLPNNYLSLEKTNSNFIAYLTHSTKDSSKNKEPYSPTLIYTNIEDFNARYNEALEKVLKPTRQEQKLNEFKEIINNIMTLVDGNYEITNMPSLVCSLMENDLTKELKYVMDKYWAMSKLLSPKFQVNSYNWASSELDNIANKELQEAKEKYSQAINNRIGISHINDKIEILEEIQKNGKNDNSTNNAR